jgi:hypothetical protein
VGTPSNRDLRSRSPPSCVPVRVRTARVLGSDGSMRKSLKIEDRETATDTPEIEDHKTADAFLARLDEARTSGNSEQS